MYEIGALVSSKGVRAYLKVDRVAFDSSSQAVTHLFHVAPVFV